MGATGKDTLASLLGYDPAVEAALCESGGEVTPEVEALIGAWEDSRERKVDSYCALIRRFDAQAAEIRAEERRLADFRRSRERAAESLRARLLGWIRAQGIDAFETGRNRVRVAPNPRPRVEWTGDPEAAPFDYLRVRWEVDLAAAHRDLEAGKALPEGFAVERGEHLRIS